MNKATVAAPGIVTSTSPGGVYNGTSTSANSNYSLHITVMDAARSLQQKAVAKKLEGAVYNYIRAIRALGRTQVTVSEIANALGISDEQVGSTLSALESKGIRGV